MKKKFFIGLFLFAVIGLFIFAKGGFEIIKSYLFFILLDLIKSS